MNKSLLILAVMLPAAIMAQIRFEPGHYIDNAGNRHEALIRNMDWNDNPRKIFVQLDADGEIYEKSIDEIAEFAIAGSHKFVRADVDMDRSETESTKKLSATKNPEFKNERLLLRVLVDGKFKLYTYEESGLMRLFYQTPAKPVSQLIFKKYHPTLAQTTNGRGRESDVDFNAVWENNEFRNQLWNDARCPDAKLSAVERLRYTKSSLTKYMVAVNNCNGDENSSTTVVAPVKKGKLNFGPIAGLGFLKFSSDRNPEAWSIGHSETSFQFGLELEYVLATNANKFAVFVQPHYVGFEGGNFTYIRPGGAHTGTIDLAFNTLSLPIGVRYYLFMGEKSRIFVDGSAIVNLIMAGKFKYDNNAATIELEGNYMNYGLSAGFNYGRYSIAAHYYTKGSLHPSVDAKLARTALTVKYFIL